MMMWWQWRYEEQRRSIVQTGNANKNPPWTLFCNAKVDKRWYTPDLIWSPQKSWRLLLYVKNILHNDLVYWLFKLIFLVACWLASTNIQSHTFSGESDLDFFGETDLKTEVVHLDDIGKWETQNQRQQYGNQIKNGDTDGIYFLAIVWDDIERMIIKMKRKRVKISVLLRKHTSLT